MSVVSLFSGIGGLELGLGSHGFATDLFCDIDDAAVAVLRRQFPGVPVHRDIRELVSLPECEILAAGFPCQDLSLAGNKAGLAGLRSGLVGEIFRLIQSAAKPAWILLENVPYMLLLDKGSGMLALIEALEAEGYSWAYRVVDARSFGLPQRRRRVLMLASRGEDPRSVLFADDSDLIHVEDRPSRVAIGPAYGFYWTMGKMGAGWAREATPPIKGGSGLGIPSPPAIWLSSIDFVGTPQIGDAERLQGFARGWTEAVLDHSYLRPSARWRLVGNAVCPPMSEWVASRLRNPGTFEISRVYDLDGRRWPTAAYGRAGKRYGVRASEWPLRADAPALEAFLQDELKPLSLKATQGFRSRAMQSKEIAWAPEFIRSLGLHIDRLQSA